MGLGVRGKAKKAKCRSYWVGEHFDCTASIRMGQRETLLQLHKRGFACSGSEVGAASRTDREQCQECKHPPGHDKARDSPGGSQAVIHEVSEGEAELPAG